ncbi:MAG: DUF4394 domain-containing protein [candidate division KSB1 bacterium]|nr:DUF4394 domain-containing protein [candidate division KSB1 bacterium]MDZ7274052.1 DUF4394 domain-containing protein [candidate division KSB1 bacterium]MDZ7286424.1 DUF4394 domain-containing protein [candidate division KSB1 bacterium]MDZ7296652.1 DUF4394 domain-containing protein [candidate division KSB1 bacterium]MDZ7307269.1 DUF4394 domain-containing protein [candidate division KSB1 bacterium]
MRWGMPVLALLCVACEDQVVQPQVKGRPLYAVDSGNNLVRFGSLSPDTVTSKAISGLQPGEVIVGIDFRPVDGRLYGLSNFSRVYTIDTVSAAALPVRSTPLSTGLVGSSFGFGFNPVPDKMRVHSNAEQDLRVDPVTGALAQDSTLAFDNSDPYFGANPNIVGTAYTNSVAGATSTALYAIDSNWDLLVYLPSPNNGRMLTIGDLGVNTNDFVGFDISAPDGLAYAALTVAGNGRSSLYLINLATGAASLQGGIGGNLPVHTLAVAP